MKTVKWVWVLLAAVLGMAVGVGGAIGVYYLTVGEVAWQSYLETELVPTVTSIASGISIILLAVLPVASRVLKAADKFVVATKEIKSTVDSSEESEAKIKSMGTRLEEIEKAVHNTEKIVRIGFGNMKELVVKGQAREIAKVGTVEEKENEAEDKTDSAASV